MTHIYAPPCHYIGQVRAHGHRKWRTVTGKFGSAKRAMTKAILNMRFDDNRARVLWVAEWHEPEIIMELKT